MDIRRLDLTLLLLLDGLLASGNLSATARRLEMSQPSASAALSRLRHFFSDELFIRTGRGLRPTPLAERLAKPVRSVIEKINDEILLQPEFQPHDWILGARTPSSANACAARAGPKTIFRADYFSR